MPKDAIEGGTYMDRTYGEEFTIVEIESEEDTSDPDDIDVVLDYETMGEITISLSTFRSSENIEFVEISQS